MKGSGIFSAFHRSMENYSKGKNVEEPMEKDNIPIPNLPEDFVWMQVRGGSKMRNLLEYAVKAFKENKSLVWSGCGPAVGKTISCVEIIKRQFNNIHQFNKICYRRCEEHWDPKVEGLDPLVVYRDLPTVHILLCHEPINENLLGYQGPHSAHFNKRKSCGGVVRKGGGRSHQEAKKRLDQDEMEALGLRSQQSVFKKKQQQNRKGKCNTVNN